MILKLFASASILLRLYKNVHVYAHDDLIAIIRASAILSYGHAYLGIFIKTRIHKESLTESISRLPFCHSGYERVEES